MVRNYHPFSRLFTWTPAFILMLFFCLTTTSCKTGEGCGLQEQYAPPTDKEGQLSTKKGKSELFSPKQRKKMKKS